MNKISPVKLKALSLLFVAVLLIGVTVVSESTRSHKSNAGAAEYTATHDTQSTEQAAVPPALYTVREHEGAVAVFQTGVQAPILTEKFPVHSLPDQDRDLLRRGVTFESYREMIAFFENYE